MPQKPDALDGGVTFHDDQSTIVHTLEAIVGGTFDPEHCSQCAVYRDVIDTVVAAFDGLAAYDAEPTDDGGLRPAGEDLRVGDDRG